MTTPRRLFEKACTLGALLLFSGILFTLRGFDATGVPDEGDPFSQAVFSAVYVLLCLALLPRLKDYLETARRVLPLSLLLAFALASYAWSVAPGITLRHGVALAGTTLFGMYFARYGEEEQLDLLCLVFACMAMSSLLLVAFSPVRGIMSGEHAGAWNGVFSHKNALGRYMSLAFSTFLLKALTGRRRVLACSGTLLCLFLLLMSRSRTGFVMAAFLPGCLFAYRYMQRQGPKMAMLTVLTMLLTGGGVLTAVGMGQETAFTYMGRDMTLTGRTVLWYFVATRIMSRPWLGFGYGAFWDSKDLGAAEIGFAAPHAHNGFLDITLSMGFVGLALYLLTFFGAWRDSYRHARAAKSVDSLWPLLFLSFLFFGNLTESGMMTQNDYLWVLYVACCVAAAQRRGPQAAPSDA